MIVEPAIGILRRKIRLWSAIIKLDALAPILRITTHSSGPTAAALATLKSASGAISTERTVLPESSISSWQQIELHTLLIAL